MSQHCWAQHVACVWPPCCGVLQHVGCCWLKFKTGQIWANNTQHVATCRNKVAKRTQHVAPNNVAICCAGMLRSFGSTLSNLQHCDCEKQTEFGFCSVKQNTVESLSASVVDVGKKSTWRVAFLSLKPQLAQDLQDVISLLFHSLSMSNISKITTKFSELSVWITSVSLSRSILLNGLHRS